MYCSCSKSPVYLCDSCFLGHRSKSPGLIHSTVPIEVVDIAAYQHRCPVFAEGKEELLQNLTRIDQCCAEFSTAIQALQTQVQQYRDEFLAQMQSWRSELSAQIYGSIAETEASLAQEVVELGGKYSAALRNYTAGSLNLFTYVVDLTQVHAGLLSIVKTNFSQPANPVPPQSTSPVSQQAANSAPQQSENTEIYWVTKDSIQCFNARTQQLHSPARLSSPIPDDGDNRWAVVSKDQVVVCGGGSKMYAGPEVWNRAFLLNVTGKVQALPNMNFGHSGPGFIVKNGIAFVFGSTYGLGGQQCEALKITGVQGWGVLPQMHKPRSGFTPAAWQQALYLCGGLNNPTVEVFDGVTMQLLSFSLPSSSGSIACVRGDTLLVLTADHFVVFAKAGEKLTGVATERRGCCYTYTLPVLSNDTIFSPFGGEVYRYSAQSGNRII